MADFKIEGGRELMAALKDFPERVRKNMLRSAFAAGAAELRKTAKQKAKAATKGEGRMADSIVVKRPKTKPGEVVVGLDVRSKRYVRVVKTRDGKHKGIVYNPKNVWHLLELGTAQRKQKKTGRSTGAIKARHIFQSTLDEAGQRAIDAVTRKLRDRIDKGK